MQAEIAGQAVAAGSLPETLVLVDEEHCLTVVDPLFCRAMQIDPVALVRQPVAQLFGAQLYRSCIAPALLRCFAGESLTHDLELPHATLGPRQFSVSYHPCITAPGAAAVVALVLHDVTGTTLPGETLASDAELRQYTLDLERTVAERTQENALLQRRADDAATLEERERLARELHDAVTQSIYSLTLFAEAGRRLASLGQLERVQEYLAQLSDTAAQALRQMRLMLYELQPSVLKQVGLVDALRQRLDAVERRAGIDAVLELDLDEPLRLSPAQEDGLYRICQEALNNALKHASATCVTVTLRRNPPGQNAPGQDAPGRGAMVLEVRDDGVGFLPATNDSGEGLGYIRDRAARLNALLSITSAPGQGASIRVTLPL